ncbi:MAG: hypothetical protein OEZ04_09720, partial [Nitrospinota bacterium]|nr:hypothetical protein [Nitrospinota bacterium]
NAEVDTSLVLNSTRLSLEFDMVNNDIGHLGVGFAGNFITNSTSLTSFGLISTTAEIKLVAPMVVGSGRIYPVKFMAVGMDVAWVGYDQSNFTDMTIHIDFNPVRNVGFSAGWRGINLTIETDADKAAVAWNGLFFQFMARF